MRVITLDENNVVIGLKYVGGDCELGPNDLASDTGNMGQIRQLDDSFIDAPPVIIPAVPSIGEQIAQLKADNQALKKDNLIIMEVLATLYEDMLAKGTV